MFKIGYDRYIKEGWTSKTKEEKIMGIINTGTSDLICLDLRNTNFKNTTFSSTLLFGYKSTENYTDPSEKGKWYGSNLSGANFSGSTFGQVYFGNSENSGSNLTNANFSNTMFKNYIITLHKSNLCKANFTGAKYVRYDGVTVNIMTDGFLIQLNSEGYCPNGQYHETCNSETYMTPATGSCPAWTSPNGI